MFELVVGLGRQAGCGFGQVSWLWVWAGELVVCLSWLWVWAGELVVGLGR